MHQTGFILKPDRPDAEYAGLVGHLEYKLRRARPGQLAVDTNSLRFTGGALRFPPRGNLNMLAGITKGEIIVDPVNNRILYRLGFGELETISIFMLGGGLIAAIASRSTSWDTYLILLLLWLWLVVLGYIIARSDFDRFMKRCIRETGFSIIGRA